MESTPQQNLRFQGQLEKDWNENPERRAQIF